MADRRTVARAHLAALAEFYRNIAVALILTFLIGLFVELGGLIARMGDLSIIGLLGLMSLLYSQRLVERTHD
jgi:hypothetical protein